MSSKSVPRISLETTGDAALDRILGGGIPTQSLVIVAGEPGSGKTVMTLQMLFHAARAGKKSLYFTTLSEPAVKVIRYMQMFEFFDPELLDEHVVMSNLGKVIREGAAATLAELEKRVSDHEPAFVVIDSFKVVAELLRPEASARSMLYDLAVTMAAWGATTILVGEYTRADLALCAEFAIADGILQLTTAKQGLTAVREIEVLKMRGAANRGGTHFYEIASRGVAFFPRVSAPTELESAANEETSERAAFGVAGLDEALGGGVPRNGTTVIQGATGTGKTLLGLQYLLEGVRQGERGMLFTLEETPGQLRAIGRSLGWDLAELEAREQLTIRYASPVELSTDRYLYQCRNELAETGARRAVFDSLTTMSLGVSSERRFKEMIYAITKHLRLAGVTSVMTAESPQLLGHAQLAGDGVSFIADNVIITRYVELDGRIERAISVLKARGIEHDSELRQMKIKRGGIDVGGGFKDLLGVLTGVPARKAAT